MKEVRPMTELQNDGICLSDGLADIILICGHYGCGKTNLALNLAAQCVKAGEKVTVVDMDIVNPYFRASDYGPLLESMGVELIAPGFAHSNVDLPSITTEMYSIFTRTGRIIIDVGGDDAGATALGRFSRRLKERPYTMLYVVNKYRSQSQSAEETVELLREIEMASHLEACAIVSNSHLMQYTTAQTVIDSFEYADEVCRLTGLPLAVTAAERRILPDLADCGRKIWPVDVLVTKPWETDGIQGDC